MTYRLLGKDPKTGLEVVLRDGRFGRFVHVGPFGGTTKPPAASVPPGMRIDLKQALALLERSKQRLASDAVTIQRLGARDRD